MEFAYYNPKSIQALADTLSGLHSYALLAGGTDLLVKMKEKLLRPMPQAVVDINGIDALQEITDEDGYLWIGSLVSHTALTESALVNEKAIILAEAAGQVGSPQIRNRGTVGGNICNASPAADTVPALLALDAKVKIRNQGGFLEIPLADVFKGPGRTCLLPGQFIAQIKIQQIQPDEGAAFLKFGKRKALAIAIINCAAWLKLADGIISDIRIAFGSVAPTPVRLYELEKWLIGKQANAEVFAQAGVMAAQMIKPIDDVRSKASYRTRLARVIVFRSLMTALERVQVGCRCE
ncbi:xanthine dehydrogenase family protein subunit M [Sporomusa sp.]|uniref:FAD binding domain-containing protein n=1 Tax=Sporomusa sp. TaxID=2078658 RepID=UPI002CF030D7|nr:xanthine dehydrogenase family protein subunit M [Sporomusa sp.]HWR42415.1 xanthine dehydrogenase family protein subunit M [Sporomusa sp.]